MQHKRKARCYCFTAESIFKLQVSTLHQLPIAPWTAGSVPPGSVHVSSSQGRLEDATKVLQTVKFQERKTQIKQHMLYTRSSAYRTCQSKVEYQFSHLATPHEYISDYRRSCSSVSSTESLINNRNTSSKDSKAAAIRSSAELSYILLDSPESDISYPLSRPLFRGQGSSVASKLLNEYWSTSMSTVDTLMNIKGNGLLVTKKQNEDRKHDEQPHKLPLVHITPTHYRIDHTPTILHGSINDHPVFTVDEQSPVRKPISTCLYNIPINAMIVRESTPRPDTTTNCNTAGKLLSARLRALSDSGTATSEQDDISNTLQSKPLLMNNKSLETLDKQPMKSQQEILHSTSSPNFIHTTVSHQTLPPPDYYNPRHLYIGKDSTKDINRTSVSARVKHRLSLGDTPTQPKKPSAYLRRHRSRKNAEAKKHHQRNCLKKSLQRHITTGKWLYIDRNVSAPPTLDDVIHAE